MQEAEHWLIGLLGREKRGPELAPKQLGEHCNHSLLGAQGRGCRVGGKIKTLGLIIVKVLVGGPRTGLKFAAVCRGSASYNSSE